MPTYHNMLIAQIQLEFDNHELKQQIKTRDAIILKLMRLCGDKLPSSYDGLVKCLS